MPRLIDDYGDRAKAAVRKAERRRAVTIVCTVCGIEITGIELTDGTIRASDHERPALDAPVRQGRCVLHENASETA